jgi:hypothetical protein
MIAAVRTLRILGLALVMTAVSVAMAQAGALRYFIDSEPPGVGTLVVADLNPSALTSKAETPNSVALLLPAGWRFDRHAVARECTPSQAASSSCPRAAQIGYGHTVVHVTGYLFPGGETNGVAYMTPFLGPPQHSGDRASIVLQVQVLGLAPFIDAVKQYTGVTIRTAYSLTGRVIPLHSGPYGLKLTVDGFPGGFTVPPPLAQLGVTVSDTRFKLLLGAVRRVTKKVYDYVKAPTISGGTQTLKIPDRRQIGYHMLRKGPNCPGRRSWPYQIQIGFPDGTQKYSAAMSCTH